MWKDAFSLWVYPSLALYSPTPPGDSDYLLMLWRGWMSVSLQLPPWHDCQYGNGRPPQWCRVWAVACRPPGQRLNVSKSLFVWIWAIRQMEAAIQTTYIHTYKSNKRIQCQVSEGNISMSKMNIFPIWNKNNKGIRLSAFNRDKQRISRKCEITCKNINNKEICW